MRITSTVAVIIHATSPLSTVGVTSSVSAGAAADVTAASSGAAMSVMAAGSSAPTGAVNATAPNRATSMKSFFISISPCVVLERLCPGLAGANADGLFEIEDEDLPVADLSGVGRLLDRFDDLLEQLLLDGDFDLDLGEEIDDVLCAPVQFGVSLLPAEALDLGDGDALYADGGEGLPHLVKLERLDDRGYEFHWRSLG